MIGKKNVILISSLTGTTPLLISLWNAVRDMWYIHCSHTQLLTYHCHRFHCMYKAYLPSPHVCPNVLRLCYPTPDCETVWNCKPTRLWYICFLLEFFFLNHFFFTLICIDTLFDVNCLGLALASTIIGHGLGATL